jgi:uncharacterized protein (DUF4213/DUF364 family)
MIDRAERSMPLIDDLLESIRLRDFPVKRLTIGSHWTVVESRYVGLAHAYKARERRSIESSKELIGTSAFEIAQLIRSPNVHEAGMGAAALNSLIEPSGRPGNVFIGIFEIIPGKTVTVVGRFPIYGEIAGIARRSYLLELEPREGELPARAGEEVIPQSDIVVISATSLINKTLPHLLELCAKAHAKAFIIGPSTPMSDILLRYGAYRLGGVRVTDIEALIESALGGAKSSKELAGVELIVKP